MRTRTTTGETAARARLGAVALCAAIASLIAVVPAPVAQAETKTVTPPYASCNKVLDLPRPQACTFATGTGYGSDGRVGDTVSGLMQVSNPPNGNAPAELSIVYTPTTAAATTIHVSGDFSFLSAAGNPAVSVGFCAARIPPGGKNCQAPTKTKLYLLHQQTDQNPTVAPLHADAVITGTFPAGTVVRAWFRVVATAAHNNTGWVSAMLTGTQITTG